jgi:PAS domain S-box-containing protein
MKPQENLDAMALSQQDLLVLLDHSPDAIGRFNRQLQHIYVNHATAAANGRSAREFPGKTMEDLGHPPEVCDLINRNLQAVFQSGQERTFEILFEALRGPCWYQCRMAPEFSEEGVESVLVISRDISEQRRVELASRETEKKLAVAEVSSRLAHGIHNPLATVTNIIYLLQHNESLDQEAREMVLIASQELDRVAEITKRLLVLQPSVEI